MSINPCSPSFLSPVGDDFELDPAATTSKRHVYPRTSPPARPETPPTPELTLAFNTSKLWEAKAPPPLNLPESLSLPLSHTHSESAHGSPVVSPCASSSSSSRWLESESESGSARSSSPEMLGLEDEGEIKPPSPPYLHENSRLDTQGKMIWRPTYIPYPRGMGLPYAIIEEEEPPEESSESCYSAESAPLSSQQPEKEENRPTLRSHGSDPSGLDKKKRKLSLKKRIKRMFVEKRDAVRMGLKV